MIATYSVMSKHDREFTLYGNPLRPADAREGCRMAADVRQQIPVRSRTNTTT